MLKVGDTLICHSKVIMNTDGGIRTTVGKSYKIIGFKKINDVDHLAIINDSDREHRFSVFNYNRWFYTVNDLRRKKLKKIQNVKRRTSFLF